MPKQPAFPGLRDAMKKKQTRRGLFLAGMEAVVPWGRLLALIEPQTRLARHLLGAVGPTGATELPASLRARIDATGPLAGCLDALRPAPDAELPTDERLDIAPRMMIL
jgi:hypothetical protein